MPKGDAPADGGRVINLDAARAARKEAAGDPVTVTLAGASFALPTELPFLYADHLSRGELREAVGALLGERTDEFFALGLSMDDAGEFVDQVNTLYGVTEGESPASPTSS